MHFVYENFGILIQISLKFVPEHPIDNKLAVVEAMAWHWTGNQGWLSSSTHVCDNRGRWVNSSFFISNSYSNLWWSLTVRVVSGKIGHRWGNPSGTTSNDIAGPVLVNTILWWVYIRMLAKFNSIESCHSWIEEYDLACPPFEATTAQLDWSSENTFSRLITLYVLTFKEKM